ncbi:putative NUDIX hydrolase [Aquimixticola soesokkakensis]|uniref:Putative NUDIX hydrolase n=1 Tax=Aquimixticola soesokkakensis TaxID=1519096 RepID=A0A1Y5R810_9RHOB|nr:CoA pyrophosphatase [Aquimixticola soesokkakensis]SLN11229.1 putative NUDIX hydrolase [Aquimixticola soesokkakensis]
MTQTVDLGAIRHAIAHAGSQTTDFDLNPAVSPPKTDLRAAAVLVPLIAGADGIDVILTKRSSALKHHPGQIAFPGGKVDPEDATPTAAALREAWEEIGLPLGQVEVLGTLASHVTVTGFRMVPVVGWIADAFDSRAEVGEVAEVFRVPLAHLANLDNYRIEGRLWRGQRREYYTVPWGPYYIWGATARILKGLADLIAHDQN